MPAESNRLYDCALFTVTQSRVLASGPGVRDLCTLISLISPIRVAEPTLGEDSWSEG